MEIFASGVADTAGEVTLTFSAPGMGMALSGTLTVPGVDASAGWLCKKNGHTIGGWLGQSAFGPVTANDQETIALVGTGLSAGQQVQACWHVVQGRSGDFSSVVPLAVMPAAQAGISGTVDANITGPVTVETASGTPVDANITNASIPVSGSVDATILNATLDITGSTVDIGGAVDVSGSTVAVSTLAPNPITLSDYSGSILSANVSQLLVAANSGRKYLLIQNLSENALWINWGAAATIGAPSVLLEQAQGITFDVLAIATEALYGISPVAGTQFVLKEA